MDTKAHAGWRNMCLAVCGVLMALAAHTTQGIPVLQRITPTAKLPYRPSTPIPLYRKSFRSWAKKQHEDLWVGAPSGDGPTDEWYSSYLSSQKVHLPQSTVDNYITRSPTPEDIFPSLSDPFPTVIDTTVETSEVFSDELLTRRSEAFEGPSSLLNTFIFRPSVTEESSTLISPTPSLEFSLVADQTAFYLSASWTDMGEEASSFTMSSRRALSDIPSDVYAIITAISATHIYGDDFLSLHSDPSDFNFLPWLSSSMERFPDSESSTSFNYFPSFTTSPSVHLQNVFNTKRPELSNNTHSVSKEKPYSILSSPTDIILQQNISDPFIKSAFPSKITSLDSGDGYQTTFVDDTFLYWSPLTTPKGVHTSSISKEVDYFNSIDSSFSESINFLSSSDIFPVKTNYDTFLLNTVETTVTIIKKETPFTFIRPTLTVSGTSFNKATENVSKFEHDIKSSLSYENFHGFSSLKHLSFSFISDSLPVLSTEDNFNLLTELSKSQTKVDLSPTTTLLFSVLKSNESSQNVQDLSVVSSEPSAYIQITSTPAMDKINEILASSQLSFFSKSFFETDLNSVEATSIIYNETEYLSTQAKRNHTIYNTININSSKSEIQPQLTSELQTKEETFDALDVSYSELTATFSKEIFPSIRTSFNIQEEQNAYSSQWNSSESINNQNVYQTRELENEIISSRQSIKDEVEWDTTKYSLPNTNMTFLFPRHSNDLVTSTHHVTYRSLRDSLNFDSSDYEATEEIPTKTLETYMISNELNEYFSSVLPLQTISDVSSVSNIKEKTVSTSQPHSSPFIDSSVIMNHTEEFINGDLTILFESSLINKSHSTELSLKFSPSSTSGEIVSLLSSMHPVEATNEGYEESLLYYSSSKHSQEKSSLIDLRSTPSLESSMGLDFNGIMSENLSLSLAFMTPDAISTSVLDDYTHILSDLDNYFLESSNISSKSLEEHIVQSPLINVTDEEAYMSSSESSLSSSEKFESSFLLMSFEVTPIIFSPTMSFQVSLKESETFDFNPISEIYVVSHDSTVLQTTEVETLPSLDHHESHLYDSDRFKSYISSEYATNNFFVEMTPSFSSYAMASSLFVDTLQPGLEIENVSCEFYSIPYILPHSVITTKSEKIDLKSQHKDNSVDIINHSITSDSIHPSIKTQIQLIPSAQVSILSSNIQHSFSKIDALDLSLFTQELPFSTLEYITLPEVQSTVIKQARSIESYYPKYELSSEFQETSFVRYDSYFSTPGEETSNLLPLMNKSQIIDTNDLDAERTTLVPSFTHYTSKATKHVLESQIFSSLKSKEPSGEGSIHSETKISASLTTSVGLSYDGISTKAYTLLTSHPSLFKEPQSIESNIPVRKPSSLYLTPLSYSFPSWSTHSPLNTPSSYKEPKSVLSDLLKTPSPSLPTHSFLSSTKHLYETSTSLNGKEPKSIESDHPRAGLSTHSFLSSTKHSQERSTFLNGKEPESIESDHPKPKSTLMTSSYASLASASSKFQTLISFSKIEEPKSIDSEHPKSRYFSTLESTPVISTSSKSMSSPSYSKPADPLSIESDRPKPKISSSIHTPVITSHTSFLSMKPQFESSSSLFRHQFHPSSVKPSSMRTISNMFSSTDLRPTWSEQDNKTPDETVFLPASSFLNVNQTRNASNGESTHTNEKSQIDESLSTNGDQTTPTDRTFLFKDNHYWVLTVLEAPVKGHLPENFSHTMELRLANAYSETFRLRAARNNETRSEQDRIIVKILSLTEDLLLRQLEIVYVVERGGALVPASVASDYLSSLRFEQLREFLGHHVIVKARPYKPRDNGQPVGSPVPVLAIVGGVLGSLLLLFCCFCIYCRCCRPKPLPSTPDSSTSGSLQRSLSKYGQHNRKHLFREMTHQLTTEMAAQMKQGSSAPDTYLADKRAGRSLPTLPREGGRDEEGDKSMKILKILENKDASTSPVTGRSTRGTVLGNDTSSSEQMKRTPKPKKRRKIKDSNELNTKDGSQPESPPPTPPPKGDVSIPTPESRQSSDSRTSSRGSISQTSSPSDKSVTETESEGSHAELLPQTQGQTDRSEHEDTSSAVETQIHLSRVRQRIAELLDDAFALAGGRKLYGSLRSKKVEPSPDIFPRFGSFRSQSATGGDYAFRHPGSGIPLERRPMTEGGQRLMGVITDEGQLITHPPPKLVWEQDEGAIIHEVIEARNLNLFPFHHQHSTSRQHIPALRSSLEALPESCQYDAALEATLRDAASELQLARSAGMNPAVVGQYDEIDVVSALRNGEPVEALIKAIKDELMRFSGSFPGEGDSESHA